MPWQTGHVWWFGGAPKVVAQPQNIFERVRSCAWTSRPMTVSQAGVMPGTPRGGHELRPAPRRARRPPRRCRRTRNSVASSKGLAMTWSPIGSPASENPHGTEIAGTPASGAGIVKTSFRYIAMGRRSSRRS